MQARSLAGGKTDTIGVAVFGSRTDFLSHHLFYEVLQGIQTHAAMNTHDLLLFSNRSESDSEYWQRIGDRRKVDGLIVMGEQIREQYLDYYYERGIPFVLVGKRYSDQVPLVCVTSDYRTGAYDAVKHLLLQGRRRIMLIRGLMNHHHEDSRMEGYVQALREFGLTPDESLIMHARAERAVAYDEMRRRIAEGRLDFDAIFSGNDLMALGAMDALAEQGISVPGQVAVVGFDDIQAAAHYKPALTTVQQDKIGLGRAAAGLLMQMIDSGIRADESQTHVIGCRLIVRDSSVV